MASFFTRLTYNYADRYLGTYTYRYDGSSNFGPENRWAGFHSLATSWRFSNETFFEPLKKVISNGKLRLGWGQTGNANIGGYAWGTSMSRMPSGLGMGIAPPIYRILPSNGSPRSNGTSVWIWDSCTTVST